MARLNLEDTIDSDPRFKRLTRILGNDDQAMGMLIRFWRLAQLHWGKHELIPLAAFDQDDMQPVIEAGLGERRADGIYARGSEERFAWYRQRCEAATLGVESRKKPQKNDKKEKTPKITGSSPPVNRTVSPGQPDGVSRSTGTPPSGTTGQPCPVNPLSLSLLNTKEQSKDCSLVAPPAESTTAPVKNTGLVKQEKRLDTTPFLAKYVEVFQARYGKKVRPVLDGMALGEARRICEGVGVPLAIDAAEAYLQLDDPKYLAKCHDLLSLRMDLQRVCVALQKGIAEPNKNLKSQKWERDFLNDESQEYERVEGN